MVAFELFPHAIVLYTSEDLLLILGNEGSAEFLPHYLLELLLVTRQRLIRLSPRNCPTVSPPYISAFLPPSIYT